MRTAGTFVLRNLSKCAKLLRATKWKTKSARFPLVIPVQFALGSTHARLAKNFARDCGVGARLLPASLAPAAAHSGALPPQRGGLSYHFGRRRRGDWGSNQSGLLLPQS